LRCNLINLQLKKMLSAFFKDKYVTEVDKSANEILSPYFIN